MAEDISSYLVASAAAAVVATSAVAVWAARSARPEPATADAPVTAPKLAGGPAEIRGLVSVLLAAAVVVVVPGSHSVESAEWLSALVLVLAVALRGYRLARPGPAVLDRLTVALALVPACALFGGASVVVAYDGSDDLSWWGPWLLGYVVAGVLALVAARAWRKD